MTKCPAATRGHLRKYHLRKSYLYKLDSQGTDSLLILFQLKRIRECTKINIKIILGKFQVAGSCFGHVDNFYVCVPAAKELGSLLIKDLHFATHSALILLMGKLMEEKGQHNIVEKTSRCSIASLYTAPY